jgi:hypothetical protein
LPGYSHSNTWKAFSVHDASALLFCIFSAGSHDLDNYYIAMGAYWWATPYAPGAACCVVLVACHLAPSPTAWFVTSIHCGGHWHIC